MPGTESGILCSTTPVLLCQVILTHLANWSCLQLHWPEPAFQSLMLWSFTPLPTCEPLNGDCGAWNEELLQAKLVLWQLCLHYSRRLTNAEGMGSRGYIKPMVWFFLFNTGKSTFVHISRWQVAPSHAPQFPYMYTHRQDKLKFTMLSNLSRTTVKTMPRTELHDSWTVKCSFGGQTYLFISGFIWEGGEGGVQCWGKTKFHSH